MALGNRLQAAIIQFVAGQLADIAGLAVEPAQEMVIRVLLEEKCRHGRHLHITVQENALLVDHVATGVVRIPGFRAGKVDHYATLFTG